MKTSQLFQSFFANSSSLNRRNFIANTGKSLLAASVLGNLSSCTSDAQSQTMQSSDQDTTPIKLKPLDAVSERKKPDPPAPMNPGKRLGFALVGLGHLTLEEILPAFGECKYAKPVALVSGDAAKAQKVADQYGIIQQNIYNYQNFDQIKDNKQIDVVYIVLPNSMHEEFTIRAAKAGKHVLCEKPMTTSSASAQRMIDACEAAGRKLMVAYRIQYEPHNRMIMDWVRSRKYGKVRLIEMFNGQNTGDPTQWRLKKALAGGGSLPDIGIYCFNTARFIMGEEPEWVFATTYSTPFDDRFKEVEESVLFQMRFPGGTLVNASCCYSVHEARRYRCLADNGAWFGLDPAFSYSGLEIEMSEAKDKNDWKEHPQVEAKNQFALEMDHMVQCVMNNQKPYTPGEEGLQDHKIMEAFYQSAKEGKPVKLERNTKIDSFRGTPPKKDE